MSDEDSFLELFAPEQASEGASATAHGQVWKVLLVDDEPDIHAALHLALRDVEVEGIALQLFDTGSAAEARKMLGAHPDMALILLDVVMESDRAGLDLVRYLREELQNRLTQIVVLTGQPGYAPQRSVIADYKIDGYRLKSELAADKIFVTVYSAIRTHQALRDLEQQRVEYESMAQTLREREERLRTVLETAPDAILMGDAKGIIIGWNEGAQRIFGYQREQMVGASFLQLVSPAQRPQVWSEFEALQEGKNIELLQGKAWEASGRRADDREMPIEVVLGSWVSAERRYFSAIVRDISERKRTEADLRLAASVYAQSYEGIIISDALRLIVDVNPAFTRITGYAREEVLGRNARFLISKQYDAGFLEEIEKSIREVDFWTGEINSRRKNGSIYPEFLTISVIRDPGGKATHYIEAFTDISLIKEQERELIRVANYDTLTGLPNRRLLADRLLQTMAHCRRTGRSMALCYLDLDGFKKVNDELGHAVGDHLLVEIAERLKLVLREGDTLARLGGDEFVLLLVDLASLEGCRKVLDRVLHKVGLPVLLAGHIVTVSASIGVSVYPADDVNADTLLRHADQAMYQAKDRGKNRYCVFDAEQAREQSHHRLHVERMAQALARHEFVLHYQPKVDLSDGSVVGAEALIRWQHPERGLLAPAEFLHFIDGDPLEIEVGEWVLNEVLTQITAWKAQRLHVTVSANIGGNHLLQPNFAERLRVFLEKHPDVRPGDLELEILETSGLADMKAAIETLNSCRRLGAKISLDDFGTGYSSLTYFLKLPIQMLKVDQSFVRGMRDDPNELGMVEGMVKLACAFNHPVIAEGVETAEHGAMLLALGCRLAQGYGVARPMPAGELPAWVEQWRRAEPWRKLPELCIDENLVLSVARKSYNKWTEDLIANHNHPEVMRDSIQDSCNCAFGRWYVGSGSVRYGSIPVYQKIGQMHEHSHELAGALLEAPRKSPEAAQLVERIIVVRDQLNESMRVLLEEYSYMRGIEGRVLAGTTIARA